MTKRQDWIGLAARWLVRQGLSTLALTVLGMVAFVVASFLVFVPLGWFVAGAACWYLEYLTREER